MYPRLTDLLQDLFGFNLPLPIQTFGFFVALAFIAASWLLSMELKRKRRIGQLSSYKRKVLTGQKATTKELAIQAIIGFLLGYKLVYVFANYSGFTDDPQGYLLSTDGNWLAGIAGAALAAWFRHREKEKQRKPHPQWEEMQVAPEDHVGNITMVAAVAGIIGAKIFHNLENPAELIADPIGALISFSGLTIYGGIICGGIAIIMYCRKNHLNTWHVADAIVPGLMLAYAIGRIGCQLSGDGDWGIVNTHPAPAFFPEWFWKFDFPHNVINEGVPIPGCTGKYCSVLPEPVYPTSLYETIVSTLLFGALWGLRKRIHIPGMLTFIYLVMNGTERFFIEKIRVNTKYIIFGNEITQAEIISSLMILGGLAGIIWLYRKYKSKEKLVNETEP